MMYGYARGSTEDHKLNLQLDALKQAGRTKIFKEKVSAAKERPELEKVLAVLRKGDTVVVWKLDRLGRSLKHLIELIATFDQGHVRFLSLMDNINTSTAQGRFIFNVFASLAEFERKIIQERTKAGLEAARPRDRNGGRPKGLSLEAQLKAGYAEKFHADPSLTINYICSKVGVSRRTLYNYLKWEELTPKKL